MSVAVYPVFDHRICEADRIDGKMLARELELLDAFATRGGVSPLSEFISVSPEMRELAIEEGADPDSLPAEVWFEADTGLATVGA